MERFSAPTNPDVVRIKDKLRELKKQLAMVELKTSNPKTEAIPSFFEAPTLGLHYIRFKREAVTREKIFELLTQQYEMAKIEEAKEGITFQVIEPAIPPEKKIKPKRKLIVMVAGITSLFAGILFVLLLESLANLKEPEEQGGEGINT
jgi:capsule polysaccharide export protein KpsE/RkpR